MSVLRISLFVAIVAGLGAAGLAYYEVSTQVPRLQGQRDTEHKAKVDEIAAHGKTKTQLKKTESDLKQTKQELADTQGERDKAVKLAEDKTKLAEQLTSKLATVSHQRDEAQNNLAQYTVIGLSPEQVLKLNKQIKDIRTEIEVVNGEKLVLLHTIGRLTNELNKYVGPGEFVKLRPDLHGKILVVDPKWDFVVLNIGEDQGALSGGELLVSRSGKLVAKLKICSVQKDRCIANLVPSWKLGDMIEGDEVSPAHPAT